MNTTKNYFGFTNWFKLAKKNGNETFNYCLKKFKQFNSEIPQYAIMQRTNEFTQEISYFLVGLAFGGYGSKMFRKNFSNLHYIPYVQIPKKYINKLSTKFKMLIDDGTWDYHGKGFKTLSN